MVAYARAFVDQVHHGDAARPAIPDGSASAVFCRFLKPPTLRSQAHPVSVEDMLRAAHPRLVALNCSGLTLREYQDEVRAAIAGSRPAQLSEQTLERAVAKVSGELAPQITSRWLPSNGEPLWVSFAEHHASVSHPEMTNAVSNLAMIAGGSAAHVRTLSCGTIPLDNELFPRGVVVAEKLVPLASNRQRRRAVIDADPWDIHDSRKRLHSRMASDRVEPAVLTTIMDWFDELAPQIDGLPSLWQQITVLNQDLGRRMFADQGFRYTSVPMELVAAQILIEWFVTGTQNWITEMLTDTGRLATVVRALDGTTGFFSLKRGRGTVFIWQRGSGHLRPLGLSSPGEILRTAPAWVEALSYGSIVPSATLAMLIIAFALGVPNFGGLLQFDYLATARRRLLEPAAGLSPEERARLSMVPDSFYVNFESRPATRAGLARLADPIAWPALEREADLAMSAHTDDCLTWLASSSRGGH